MNKIFLLALMIIAFSLNGCAWLFERMPAGSGYEERVRKMYENGSISKAQYQNWMYEKGVTPPSNVISPDGKTTQWEHDQMLRKGEIRPSGSDDSLRIYLQGAYGDKWKEEYKRRTGKSVGY